MRETTIRILCDICGKELEPYAGISQFKTEWVSSIVIDEHTQSREIKDTCVACNSAICELIFNRTP